MSASIIDPEHIHVLLWAAAKPIPPNGPMYWYYDNPVRCNHVDPDGGNRDELGQMLLEENIASINHLYHRDDVADRYSYRRPQHTEWTVAELLNAIRGFQYQSCEHPGWERSQAKAFCDALQQRLIATLPGYADGPWHITASSMPASVERRSRHAAQQALTPHAPKETTTMSNHTESGHARTALYTVRAANVTEVGEYNSYRDGEPTYGGLWVLDLSNEDGDGLALLGSRRELVDYLELVTTHLEFETDPRGELDQALRRLHALREERGAALDAADFHTVSRLDEQEVTVLQDVAYAAELVNDSL